VAVKVIKTIIAQNHAPYVEKRYSVNVLGGFGSSNSISPLFHRLWIYFAASCFLMCSFLATSSTVSFNVNVFMCRMTLRTFFSISFSIDSPTSSWNLQSC